MRQKIEFSTLKKVDMYFNFKEIASERAKRSLGFLSRDKEIISSCIIFAFGHWHGHKNHLKDVVRKFTPDTKILIYKKESIPWKMLWAYFLIGDRFCLHCNKPNVLSDLYENLLVHFLSVSFYFIPKSSMDDFLSAIAPEFNEMDADNFLDSQSIEYLIYRIDSDAPVESGFTEELCYGEHTPSQWLAYFGYRK